MANKYITPEEWKEMKSIHDEIWEGQPVWFLNVHSFMGSSCGEFWDLVMWKQTLGYRHRPIVMAFEGHPAPEDDWRPPQKDIK